MIKIIASNVKRLAVTIPGYNSGNQITIATRATTGAWQSTVTTANDHLLTIDSTHTYANYDFSSNDWWFELVSDDYAEDGTNTVTFKFHFNSEAMTDKAKVDVGVKLEAYDRGKTVYNSETDAISYEPNVSIPGTDSTAEDAKTGLYRVDVVPYITKVTTYLSAKKIGNASVYNRTARGHYPVMDDETLTLEGFNLTTAAKSVEVSGITTSGEYAVTVSSVSSLNNKNSNDARGTYTGTVATALANIGDKTVYDNWYNRTPNGDNNENLNDDVILDIYKVKDGAYPRRAGLTEPVMRINPINGKLAFAFANGSDSWSFTPGGTTGASTKRWMYNYADFTGISFVFDESGRSHGTAIGLDTHPDQGKAGYFGYYVGAWGDKVSDGVDGSFTANNLVSIDSIGIHGNALKDGVAVAGNNDWWIDVNRFRSPSIAAVQDGNGYHVALAYYDDIMQQIRFRYGYNETVGTTRNSFGDFQVQSNNTNKGFVVDKNNFTLLAGKEDDNTGDTGITAGEYVAVDFVRTTETVSVPVYINNIDIDKTPFQQLSNTYAQITENYNNRNRTVYAIYCTRNNSQFAANNNVIFYNENHEQIGTGKILNDNTNLYSNDHYRLNAAPTMNSGHNTNEIAYMANSNNLVYEQVLDHYDDKEVYPIVAVWHDGEDLLYSYKTDFSNEVNINCTDSAWATPKTIFTGAGEYCTIKTDAAGGIHIAAYNTDNADLMYAHLSSYNATYSENTDAVTVDCYAITGTEIMIDTVAQDVNGSKVYIPYISYYVPSIQKVKTAYLVAPETGDINYKLAGADVSTEKYTGNWEITVIPSESKIQDDHTSIGFYKDDDGYAKEIPTGIDQNNTGINDKEQNCYGNGTANPVIAYAVKKTNSGAIEVAQMK